MSSYQATFRATYTMREKDFDCSLKLVTTKNGSTKFMDVSLDYYNLSIGDINGKPSSDNGLVLIKNLLETASQTLIDSGFKDLNPDPTVIMLDGLTQEQLVTVETVFDEVLDTLLEVGTKKANFQPGQVRAKFKGVKQKKGF